MPFIDPAFPIQSLRNGLEARGWIIESRHAEWPVHTLWVLSSQRAPQGFTICISFDGDIGEINDPPKLVGSISVGCGIDARGVVTDKSSFRITRWPDVLSEVLEHCDLKRSQAAKTGP